MFYNNLEVNCKVFSNKQDWRIRVVFDEDGSPLYCGRDVADSMGYDAPGHAVTRFKGKTVVAPIPWENTTRKGCSSQRCFTEASMMQFIKASAVRPIPGFLQWVNTVVIPGAKLEEAANQLQPKQEPAPALPAPVVTTPAAAPTVNVAQRIDEIILELMLLKKSLG